MENIIYNAFKVSGFNYHKILDEPDRVIYKARFNMENAKIDSFVELRIKAGFVLISSSTPINIPETKRKLIAEFITRANNGLYIGNFDMYFNDGDISFRCNYLFNDDFPISEEIFISYLDVSLNMMDRYIPGIMSILYGNVEPKAAISQIENTTDTTMN